MKRACLHCKKRFTPSDLEKGVSKQIEAERKSCRLQGILFRCYVCSSCGQENLFVDLHPLKGETPEEFLLRSDELTSTVRLSRPLGVPVGVTAKGPTVYYLAQLN